MSISSLLYRLKLADQRVTQLFEKGLSLSLTRYELLQVLLDLGSCSQQVLEKELEIDRAAITRHLKILEEAGYIKKERNPLNQREMQVRVTKKALFELVESPSKEHLFVQEQMEQVLSKKEAETFMTLLDRLVTGLEAIQIETEKKE